MYEDIISKLDRYMRSSTPGACYVDGSWGSGKTYFIKRYIAKRTKISICRHPVIFFREKNIRLGKIIYLSLNGIKKIEEIDNKINCLYYENTNKIKNNIIIKSGTKMFKFLVKNLVKIDIDGSPLDLSDSSKGNKPSSKKEKSLDKAKRKIFAFVFDDLERCQVDLIELMGYLSNLIEQCNSKVVVIGNEDEIKKFVLKRDSYIEKYFEIHLRKKYLEYDPKNIKEDMTDLLFLNNSYYSKIKEKVFKEEIKFVYDPNIIFSSGIISYFEYIGEVLDSSNNQSNNIKKSIMRIMQMKNCQNIRIAMIGYEKANNFISEVVNNKLNINNEVKSKILEQAFSAVLTINLPSKNDKNKENILSKIDFEVPFPTVIDFIKTGRFNKGEYEHEYKAYSDKEKNKVPKEIMDLKCIWKELTDEELKDRMEKLYKAFMKDKTYIKYSMYVYKTIAAFNKIGYKKQLDLEALLNYILDTINNSKTEIEYIEDFDFEMRTIKDERMNALDQIDKALKKKKYDIYYSKIRQKLKNVNYNYSLNEKKEIMDNAFDYRAFISLIGYDDFITAIKNNNMIVAREYIRLIKDIYKPININDFFKSELPVFINLLQELQELLKGCDEEEKIKIANLKEFIEIVEDIINRLNND